MISNNIFANMPLLLHVSFHERILTDVGKEPDILYIHQAIASGLIFW